ncbi:MAG: hypothetical protein QW407_07195 [Thermofilaceae archaeon]
MGPSRGTIVEVEVDHRRIPYAEFVKMLSSFNGKILSRDGFWPLSKYKVLVPRKGARELIRLLEEAQRSEA